MANVELEAKSTESNIGERIRRARHLAGLSTRALAAKAHVSQSLVSQVERSECEPSLNTLRSFAEALGVTPYQLLGEPAAGAVSVTRSGSPQRPFSDSPGAVVGRTLANNPGMMLEAYDLTVSASGDEQWFEHEGEDLVIVLSGSMVIHFEGAEPTTLAEGDTIHHSGHMRHQWRPIGDQPVRVIHVVASGGHSHATSG